MIPCFCETRRALLIGINEYQASAHPERLPVREIANLQGCLKDVEAMDRLLANWNFKQREQLKNSEATRNAILSKLDSLIAASDAGDALLFYFSGHGSQVRNSKTDKPSGYDVTIIPADVSTTVHDIRDKELQIRFNQALKKGIRLIAIFDSCHSGSMARDDTRIREIPPNTEDVADPPLADKPEDHPNALFISACQDDQAAAETPDEHGVYQGLLTRELVMVLRTIGQTESTNSVMQRVTARMQATGRTQLPTISGKPQRRSQPLVEENSLASNYLLVAVRAVEGGKVQLHAGFFDGLSANCELSRFDGRKGVDKTLRLRISDITGATTASADIVAGKAEQVKSGDIFAVDKWVIPGGALLKVHFAPATLPYIKIQRITVQIAQLPQLDPRVKIVEDVADAFDPFADSVGPASESVVVMSWTGMDWQLSLPSKMQHRIVKLGPDPTPQEILRALPPQREAHTINLVVELPPASEIVSNLEIGAGKAYEAIQIVSSPEQAQYRLVGRTQGNQIEYAWVRNFTILDPTSNTRNAVPAKGMNAKTLLTPAATLPTRSQWLPAPAMPNLDWKRLSSALNLAGLRIGKIVRWLTMESPPEETLFPYDLCIENSKSGETITDGTLPRLGQRIYHAVLVLNPERAAVSELSQPRYVYVFSIDRAGQANLLYRSDGFLPTRNPDGAFRPRIPLPKMFDAGPPYGTDTYVLLTTEDKITYPELLLNWEPVKPRANLNALEQALYDAVNGVKGNDSAPATWSIQFLPIKTVPPK